MSEDTVVSNQETPQGEVEKTGEQADLDSVLSEIDSELEQVNTPRKEEPEDKQTDSYIRALYQKEISRDLRDAVTTIQKGLDDLPVKMPDSLVEAYLDGLARRDTRIRTAFLNRDTNPEQWHKIVDAVPSRIKRDMKKDIDAQTTEDREALSAAVRGSATKNTADSESKLFERFAREASDNQINDFKRTGRIPDSFK